ncbi:hypothetical protein KSF_044920 [Reticulibacter mediterranei]|uniref:Uncharacterized protein n=1 Tax=Reticulibacter mediterranei TaxID=2778369 RepID=A0A8J3IMS5_9CHLR|nr:hypothetical protein [Reticulibacter mediterranei]GHO94444.1 hypothetical protein KSF_044920 [Reticulibacter mediterranei]
MQQHSLPDPNSVLQQVWQRDYPNTWRVFSSHETPPLSRLTILLIALIFLLFSLSLCVVFTASLQQLSWFILLFLLGFFTLSIFFVQWSRKRKERKQPKPTMVVLPDRVVEYRRQRIRTLAFADISYMRLRVEGYQDAPPSILLDINHYNGQSTIWEIDIAPSDMIAQCILDTYTTYRVQSHH